MLAYVSPFYLTVFLHITPFEYCGKILDIFMVVGFEVVHHLLLAILSSKQSKLLAMDNEGEIIEYLKCDLMKEIISSDNFSNLLLPDSLYQLFILADSRLNK